MNFSEIIVGTMRWGSWGANHSEAEVQKLVEIALQNGLYTFDHADIYGGYTTEKLFGDAVSAMNLNREDYQLISKCGIELPGGIKPFDLKSYNYSKDYILKCVDESLQNLKTDYLDVLLLHRPSPLMNPEEIAAAFGILRSNGKVRDFGVSNFTPSQFELMSQYFPYLITNQVEISINHTDAFYDGTLDQMMMKKIRPTAWSVMGNYFSNSQSEQNKSIKQVLNVLCEKYQATENQILLAFLLKHPSNIAPVVGTSRVETLVDLKDSLKINLEREDWFRLLKASKGHDVA